MAFGFYPSAWEIAQIEQLRPSDRLILLALVEHANKVGECWPSQATLAEYTGYSEKTVWTALGRLQERGLIERSHRGNGKGGRSSDLIRLLIPLVATATENPSGTATSDSEVGVNRNSRHFNPVTIANEPVIEPVSVKGEEEKVATNFPVGKNPPARKPRKVKGPCATEIAKPLPGRLGKSDPHRIASTIEGLVSAYDDGEPWR